MSTTAAQVELVEMRAEHRARKGMAPDPGDAITSAMRRFPGEVDPQLLSLRYWMHYAAGVSHPEEATDVTLRWWLRD